MLLSVLFLTIPLLINALFLLLLVRNSSLKENTVNILIHFFLIFLLSALVGSDYFILSHFYSIEIPYNFLRTIFVLALFLIAFFSSSFFVYCITLMKNRNEIPAFSMIWCIRKNKHEHKENKQDNKKTLKQHIILAAPACFGISYMVFFFGICETYFANVQEWLFPYRDILPISIVFTLVIGLCLVAIILLFIKRQGFDEGIIMLTSCFVCLYIQNAFLNTDKFINGSKDLVPHWILVLNIIIWGAFIVVPQLIYKMIKSKERVTNISVWVSVFLVIIQLAPLPYLFVSFENKKPDGYGERTKEEYRLDGTEQFTVSSEGNIIVFIMDGYQDTNFEYHLKQFPEKKELFKDYIHFDNVATEEMNTVTSMPSLLTASHVDFTIDLAESNKNAWTGKNAEAFYSEIQKNGYAAYLYSDSDDYCGDADNMVGKIENSVVTSYEIQTNSFMTFFAMCRLSLYKYLPFSLKDFLNISGSEDINQYSKMVFEGTGKVNPNELSDTLYTAMDRGICMFNFDYYASLKEGLTVEQGGKRIVFEHLFGMHEPYYGLYGKEEVYNSDEQDICFTIIEEYTRQLKELGLYDDACIIVTADHGTPKIGESDPIMLIKLPNYHGDEMAVNASPGLLQSDLLPTILDIAGADSSVVEGGVSLLQLSENAKRERVLHYITTKSSFPPAKKCNGVGFANSNCYEEYRFTGRSEEIDKDKDKVAEKPITSYWW